MKRDAGRMAEELKEDSFAHLQVFVWEAQGGFALSCYFWCTIFTAFQYQTLFTQRAHKGPTENTPTQTAYKLIQIACKLMPLQTPTQTAFKLMPLQTHPHKLLTNWYYCKHTHMNCLQTMPLQTHCKHTPAIFFKLMLLQTRPRRLLTNWCHWKTPTQIAHSLMPILYSHT